MHLGYGARFREIDMIPRNTQGDRLNLLRRIVRKWPQILHLMGNNSVRIASFLGNQTQDGQRIEQVRTAFDRFFHAPQPTPF